MVWQAKEHELHGHLAKRGVFASPRLGKTLGTTISLRELDATQALVSAPSKVCPIWMDVLRKGGLESHPLYRMTGAQIEAFLRNRRSWQGVAVVNRDKLPVCAKYGRYVGAFVADEVHNYSTPGARRGRAYRKLARSVPWVRGLTGTPTPKHYGSLWGQLMPFDPQRWDTSYERFDRRYILRTGMFDKVVGFDHEAELQQMMLDVAAIYRREDIFGPDSWQVVQRDVELPGKVWDLYRKLAREWVIDDPSFGTLSAAQAGVRMMRFQQITSGFVPDFTSENPEPTPIELHRAKHELLIEDMGEIVQSDEKIAVFHRFVPEGRLAVEMIREEYGAACPVFAINGDTDDDEAFRSANGFNATEGSAAIVVQLQSGSEGINLQEAAYIATLSRTMSFIEDEQARDRCYKRGPTGGVPRVIMHYEVPGTVDEHISQDILQPKRMLHEAVRNADRETIVFGPKWRKH